MKNLKTKLIITLIFLTTLLCANEPKIEKINHNGVDGYFINQTYYNEILILSNDNEALLKKCALYSNIVDDYEKRTRNALRFNIAKNNIMTVSIGINVAIIALFAGYVAMTYRQ